MDYQNGNFPFELAAVGLLTDDIRTKSRNLSEAEKEEMIFKYKDSESERERERIRAAASDEDDMKDVLRGPGIG